MLSDRIKSLRETIGKDYKRPDPKKLKEYQASLSNTEALGYLYERGLSDSTIKHFGLGYDKANNSIAIPIFKEGQLVNIKYRHLNPDKTKYSSERGAETWIYNEDGIQAGMARGSILIVEGEFDLMMAWQRGIRNVISPASGKDSYGVWIELLDNIPRIYIAYDNDEGGKKTALKMAERLGVDKCYEVCYPEGVKDANEYFKENTKDDFRELYENAKEFYKHQFKGLGEIIEGLRSKTNTSVKLDLVPKVEIEKDWLMVVSGRSNIGKTAYVLNIAEELAKKKYPVLILPFERGVESVGRRFLQIRFQKTIDEFQYLNNDEWQKLTDDCIDDPVYFSLPKKNEIIETIIRARRLFDVKFVIVDHLDYIVRHVTKSKEAEIADTLQELKRVAEENGVAMLIVTHIRKIDSAGSETPRKPNIEDLKGSASLYQDPEVVVMLNDGGEGFIDVDVVKNKGEMTSRTFLFNSTTGKLSAGVDI